MDLVISEPTRGHTLVDVVIADPTRVDLVARATVVLEHAASKVARQQERHYSGRPRGDTFIPIAIETYGALLSQTDEFLRDCARREFSEHGGSSPSTSILVTWFRQQSHFRMHKFDRFMRVRLCRTLFDRVLIWWIRAFTVEVVRIPIPKICDVPIIIVPYSHV